MVHETFLHLKPDVPVSFLNYLILAISSFMFSENFTPNIGSTRKPDMSKA